ncbi:MAG: Bax inhibitor-1/YccA family protein [Bacteroidota bacterium]
MREHLEFDNRSEVREREFLVSGAANAFLRQVFVTMALGLAITAMAAWWVANTPAALNFFFGGFMTYVTIFAPLVLVYFLSARVHKMSFGAASTTFAVYSVLVGISLSFIFLIYDLGTLFTVFGITAGTFGAMAVVGLTTKVDLTKMGSMLYMALIGLIIAMVVNWFMNSSTMEYIISIIGVLIFSGLTAYQTQQMLVIGANVDPEAESSKKTALIGALSLYLSFINLFLFLLRLFGGRD